MTPKPSFFSRTREAFAVLRAAGAAASALDLHRMPHARDLEVLGIDPQAFRRISH